MKNEPNPLELFEYVKPEEITIDQKIDLFPVVPEAAFPSLDFSFLGTTPGQVDLNINVATSSIELKTEPPKLDVNIVEPKSDVDVSLSFINTNSKLPDEINIELKPIDINLQHKLDINPTPIDIFRSSNLNIDTKIENIPEATKSFNLPIENIPDVTKYLNLPAENIPNVTKFFNLPTAIDIREISIKSPINPLDLSSPEPPTIEKTIIPTPNVRSPQTDFELPVTVASQPSAFPTMQIMEPAANAIELEPFTDKTAHSLPQIFLEEPQIFSEKFEQPNILPIKLEEPHISPIKEDTKPTSLSVPSKVADLELKEQQIQFKEIPFSPLENIQIPKQLTLPETQLLDYQSKEFKFSFPELKSPELGAPEITNIVVPQTKIEEVPLETPKPEQAAPRAQEYIKLSPDTRFVIQIGEYIGTIYVT